MPFLDWVNKTQAVNTATNVPYHLLQFQSTNVLSSVSSISLPTPATSSSTPSLALAPPPLLPIKWGGAGSASKWESMLLPTVYHVSKK